MNQFFVIADDFTGANDTGMQFFSKGCKVDVVLKNNLRQSDITVYNTDSRAYSPNDAKIAINKALSKMSLNGSSFVYKKIDATLRGNVGAETEALLENTPFHFAVLCSALPDKERTVEGGQCLYQGLGVTLSEFATDPKTPVVSDSTLR